MEINEESQMEEDSTMTSPGRYTADDEQTLVDGEEEKRYLAPISRKEYTNAWVNSMPFPTEDANQDCSTPARRQWWQPSIPPPQPPPPPQQRLPSQRRRQRRRRVPPGAERRSHFRKIVNDSDRVLKVCMIMDMEGFNAPDKDNTFLPREIAFICTRRHKFYHFTVDLSKDFTKDFLATNSNRYIKRCVTGLTFFPKPDEKELTELVKYEHYERVVWDIYNFERSDQRPFVAYKGGHYERDLLNKLNIPCVDLEDYGCAKAEILTREVTSNWTNESWTQDMARTCGCHLKLSSKSRFLHCPLDEIGLYKAYYEELLRRSGW